MVEKKIIRKCDIPAVEGKKLFEKCHILSQKYDFRGWTKFYIEKEKGSLWIGHLTPHLKFCPQFLFCSVWEMPTEVKHVEGTLYQFINERDLWKK